MAISKLNPQVDYEVTSVNELKSPDGDPLGILFEVRSDLCKAAKKAVKRQSAAAVSLAMAQQKGESDEAVERWLDKQEGIQLDRLIACIVSIDWGDEEWEEGGGPLDFTPENIALMLKEEWIAIQVAEWIKAATDFTKA